MTCKVLIVEDLADLLARYVKYLTEAGFNVQGVNNGEDALSALDTFFPDIIIIDVKLDNKQRQTLYPDGRILCRLIRGREAYKPHNSKFIILISAEYTSPVDIPIGYEYGADFYTARKPESREEIVSMVKALARRFGNEGPMKPIGDSDWLIVDDYLAIYRHRPDIRVCGQIERIPRTQHLILQHLHDHFGKPCSNIELSNRAGIGRDRVAVEITALRKVIKKLLASNLGERNYLDNVRGEGYALHSSIV